MGVHAIVPINSNNLTWLVVSNPDLVQFIPFSLLGMELQGTVLAKVRVDTKSKDMDLILTLSPLICVTLD